MAARRSTKSTKKRTRKFTLDQLRHDGSRVLGVLKKDGGCIVVDNEGQRIFSLWIPRAPFGDGD